MNNTPSPPAVPVLISQSNLSDPLLLEHKLYYLVHMSPYELISHCDPHRISADHYVKILMPK